MNCYDINIMLLVKETEREPKPDKRGSTPPKKEAEYPVVHGGDTRR